LSAGTVARYFYVAVVGHLSKVKSARGQ
jgi:hypothetical protein